MRPNACIYFMLFGGLLESFFFQAFPLKRRGKVNFLI